MQKDRKVSTVRCFVAQRHRCIQASTCLIDIVCFNLFVCAFGAKKRASCKIWNGIVEWNCGMELWNGMELVFGMECEMEIINLLEVNILYFL